MGVVKFLTTGKMMSVGAAALDVSVVMTGMEAAASLVPGFLANVGIAVAAPIMYGGGAAIYILLGMQKPISTMLISQMVNVKPIAVWGAAIGGAVLPMFSLPFDIIPGIGVVLAPVEWVVGAVVGGVSATYLL